MVIRTFFLYCLMIACFVVIYAALTHAQTPGANFNNRSFMYTSGVMAASGDVMPTVSAFNMQNLPKYYTLSVTTTGTGFNVELDGSLDEKNWTPITSVASLAPTSVSAAAPMLYLRLHAKTVGTDGSVTATAVGVW